MIARYKMYEKILIVYCIIKAFFALAGRPLRLFSPIGIALASGGGTAIFRIKKKSNDVNQNYCQSCHLISRNGFIIRKIMSSQICCKCMGNVITLSGCICSVQRVLQAISGKTPFWARLVINLVQRRNGQDRT
jgi:hypothetical protein